MKKRYLVGIDVGTSGTKAILADETGRVEASCTRTYPLNTPRPGWAEQDPAWWWQAVKEALAQILAGVDKTAIAGVSFSGQMHGMILLDENDQPLWNAINCLDSRAKEESEIIEKLSLEKGYRSALLNHVTTGFFVCFMYWMKRHHPEVLDKARKGMVIKDYIRYKICGEIGSDYSDAASTITSTPFSRTFPSCVAYGPAIVRLVVRLR